MHLAYSTIAESRRQKSKKNRRCNLSLRYDAYLAACDKYKDEIVAIRKYFPGWNPAFR